MKKGVGVDTNVMKANSVLAIDPRGDKALNETKAGVPYGYQIDTKKPPVEVSKYGSGVPGTS